MLPNGKLMRNAEGIHTTAAATINAGKYCDKFSKMFFPIHLIAFYQDRI